MQNIKLLKDMKTLTRNLYQLVDKSSDGLNLKSMHDCAQVISKLYGFSSWNAFKQSLPKFKAETLEEFTPFEKLDISDFKLLQSKKEILNIPKKEKIFYDNPVLQEKNLISEIIIGRKFNSLLKSHKLISLLPENFIIFSGLSEKRFFSSIKKQFKDFGHSYINLTENISPKQIKLDPWSYLFKNDGLENFFFSNEKPNDFILSWISTLRYLHHEFNFIPSTQEALNFLIFPGLFQLHDWLKANKQSSAWYFQKYFGNLGISENENLYEISAQAQKEHWQNIKNAYTLLHNLNSLYRDEIFKTQNSDQLWEALINHKNINIGLLASSEKNEFYKKMVLGELVRVFKKYKKTISKGISKNFTVGLFCENLELWSHSLLNHFQEDFLIKGWVSSSGQGLTGLNCDDINQIVFLKSFNLQIPYSLKEKILDETSHFEENIFYQQMKSIKDLDENTAYLWSYQPKIDIPEEFWPFQIEKFQLYESLDKSV